MSLGRERVLCSRCLFSNVCINLKKNLKPDDLLLHAKFMGLRRREKKKYFSMENFCLIRQSNQVFPFSCETLQTFRFQITLGGWAGESCLGLPSLDYTAISGIVRR